MYLIDKISETNFTRELGRVSRTITSSHMKLWVKDTSLNMGDMGTSEEKIIMQIFNYYFNLQAMVKDLEMVVEFLEIEDRGEIKNMYPKIEHLKDYFNYHVENFIVRIISITDIVGKIGNTIYQIGIKEKKCNGYTFGEKIKNINICLYLKIESLLDYTKNIKEKRHRLLHEGSRDYTYFYDVVIFEDFILKTNSSDEKLRKQLADKSLKAEVEIIKEEINNTVDLVSNVLVHMYDKLLELINAYETI